MIDNQGRPLEGPDPDICAVDERCVNLGGEHYCPAHMYRVASARDTAGGPHFILLGMARYRLAIAARLTPLGARKLIDELTLAVAEAEAFNVAHTRDALAAAGVPTRDPALCELDARVAAARGIAPADPAWADWPDAPLPDLGLPEEPTRFARAIAAIRARLGRGR